MEIKNRINNKTAFHCDTKEKAIEFIKKAYSLGYQWSCGNENTTYYEYYEKDTCYEMDTRRKDIHYSEIDYFENCKYTIIEYELDKNRTPLEYLMQCYDLKEEERFNILYQDEQKNIWNPFHFKDGILFDNSNTRQDTVFIALMNGECTIKKLPLKPEIGDTIWYIGANGNVCPAIYYGVEADLAMLKNGWIFPTLKQAEAYKERVMAEYKEVLDNE